jgi:predicted P-loop ATPase
MAELQALRRADAETLKAFCSRAVDRVRPPYGRSVIDIPRRCVFIGTANEGGYLVDPTGNRRFWPLEVLAEVDVEGLGRDRDQLWAEASAMEAAGASVVLDRDLWALAAERQAEETTEDPWADQVRRLIVDRRRQAEAVEADAPPADRFQTWELFDALGIPTTQQTRGASQRLKVVLTETLGWTHRRTVRIGDRINAGYVRWPDDKGAMPEGPGGPF